MALIYFNWSFIVIMYNLTPFNKSIEEKLSHEAKNWETYFKHMAQNFARVITQKHHHTRSNITKQYQGFIVYHLSFAQCSVLDYNHLQPSQNLSLQLQEETPFWIRWTLYVTGVLLHCILITKLCVQNFLNREIIFQPNFAPPPPRPTPPVW